VVDITSWPTIVELADNNDDRGSFTKVFRSDSIGKEFKEVSVARTRSAGVLRGLHYLEISAGEDKHVFCLEGEVWDVVVDIRENSPRYLQHEAFLLSSNHKQTLLIPPGFAHGYLTLTDSVTILYAMSATYDSSLERGIRWDDPILQINWPLVPQLISKKDLSWPLVGQA
jgi:dTDP-4-dehydrorhamnose 3,5-epimerase